MIFDAYGYTLDLNTESIIRHGKEVKINIAVPTNEETVIDSDSGTLFIGDLLNNGKKGKESLEYYIESGENRQLINRGLVENIQKLFNESLI